MKHMTIPSDQDRPKEICCIVGIKGYGGIIGRYEGLAAI
jgi:hypothetical protein